ncbi:MAG: hypothetical protein LUD12_01620 [Lachnospiraceae bacterium]|nr:hypothetical protein [Lachnospiraceae bacterium]
MAFIQYLNFDTEDLPEPDSYEVSMEDVEADSSGQTEAGTTQRDVVRFGVHAISVSFTVTAKWLKKFTAYKQQSKIAVGFYDTETAEMVYADMYISGYKAKREADSSYGGIWTVSFTLNEF